jgi:hypothetical protein
LLSLWVHAQLHHRLERQEKTPFSSPLANTEKK